MAHPRTTATVLAVAVAVAALLGVGGCTRAGAEAPATTVAPARAEATAEAPAPGVATAGITVAGTGRITGVPDTLSATIGVAARRPTVQEALDAANAAAEQVLGALDDAGVAAEDVQTTQFSVNPQYDQDGVAITAYEVANTVEATVRDLTAVGTTLDAVVRAGGDEARVQGVAYRLEDNAALLAEAREAAVTDARTAAEAYAAAAGLELGALTALSEVAADQPMAQAFDTSGGAEAAAPVPLAPGTQEVGVSVTATWSLR